MELKLEKELKKTITSIDISTSTERFMHEHIESYNKQQT